MKPGARFPRSRENVTKRENAVAAFAKASTAPLHTLTEAMLESIAASHARRGTRDFDQLLAKLRDTVAARRLREAA
ncbi:hypothetical protein [Novosphingobium sp. B1]|uniref:hypothetical protein n=1 Tax=Novosphingobium sp. B1 TaxID=1938756 RepID=UPI0009D84184|nr:hypothetical protein [Novosphingobium sp. B1]SMC68654.1 hypothetical protein SAMN06272759_105368 [Novosphingobium sp. B1]